MKISLTARLKTADEFFGQFTDGDEREAFDCQALIFSALANTKIPDRYDIADFLLERDCALTPAGSEANSPLHVLLSSRKHDLHRDLKLARIFLDRGVDINHRNANNEVAFAWLVDLPFTDDELADLYDLWFSSPQLLDFTASSSHYRACPLDALARIEYRATLARRVQSTSANATALRPTPSARAGWELMVRDALFPAVFANNRRPTTIRAGCLFMRATTRDNRKTSQRRSSH